MPKINLEKFPVIYIVEFASVRLTKFAMFAILR